MNTCLLETQRLCAREFTGDDLERILEITTDPDVMLYYPGTLDLEGSRQFLADIIRCYKEHGYGLWALFAKDTDDFIGLAGIQPQEFVPETETEMVIAIVKRFWNRGFATEAAIAVRDYAVKEKGLKSPAGLIHPENVSSLALAGKVGMVKQNTIDVHGMPIEVHM